MEFTFKLYLTCFHYLLLSVAMANWWVTENDKRCAFTSRIPLPPPQSCLRFIAYWEVSTRFLRAPSWWCLPSSSNHTEHHYNTVCHWLDAAIVVHTPVTLTLREKSEAALPRSRTESQAPTRPSPPPPPSALGVLWFHKSLPKTTEERRCSLWAFEPLNCNYPPAQSRPHGFTGRGS